MSQLRDYQIAGIEKLRQSLASGHLRPCMQAATGAGKTVIAAAIAQEAIEQGKRVIFTVPYLTLIDQTVERFRQNGILNIGVIQADHEMTDSNMPIQIASVQTLIKRKIPQADLVIVDECHRSFALYEKWFRAPAWLNVPFVGLTATPWQQSMGMLWDDLIVVATTKELIEKGYLSDYRVFASSHPDLQGVRTRAGDWEVEGLSQAMQTPTLIGDVVDNWIAKGEGRSTICFAVDRAHAKMLAERFKANGINCDYVDAFTTREERAEISTRFAMGYTKVVVNVGVLTTGVDWDVRCIILARPTKSEILYVQMVGRGLRTAEGKKDCIIFDHSDNTLRMGFVSDIHYEELRKDEKTVAKKSDSEKLPKECKNCGYLKPPNLLQCPACGHQPKFVGSVVYKDGTLSELSRNNVQVDDRAERQLLYRELVQIGIERGYKPGWAAVKYKSKYGFYPPREFGNQPAQYVRHETYRWVKHEFIKYAKSKHRHETTSS